MPDWAKQILRSGTLVGAAAALIVAIGARFVGVARETPPPRQAHLAETVPARITGWVAREVPLGATEFIANEVEKVLNYDEVLNREYSRAGQHVGVYVAYWGAGKMPTRLVASHTPDRCWTENGWRCLDMKFKFPTATSGIALQPAEWRIFEAPRGGGRTYVLYWHLVEGRLHDYGERFNAVPDPLAWWRDALQQIATGSREQYFIRLTSSEPWESVWFDRGFEDLLRGLQRLGIAAPLKS